MLKIGLSKKLDPNLNTNPVNILHKLIKNPTSMIINHGFLRLKNWDLASMLGLANMSGTWDLGPPCELAP